MSFFCRPSPPSPFSSLLSIPGQPRTEVDKLGKTHFDAYLATLERAIGHWKSLWQEQSCILPRTNCVVNGWTATCKTWVRPPAPYWYNFVGRCTCLKKFEPSHMMVVFQSDRSYTLRVFQFRSVRLLSNAYTHIDSCKMERWGARQTSGSNKITYVKPLHGKWRYSRQA